MTLFPFSQRQENSRHPMSALLAATVLFAGAGSVEGAVMGIDSVSTSPPLPDPLLDYADVTAITVDGSSYDVSTTATTIGSDGGGGHYWAKDGTDPGTQSDALSGPGITDGALNVNDGVVFNFGRDVTANDWIFITELGGNQDVTIKPTNDGDAIGSWSLQVLDGDWGASLFTLSNANRSPGNTLSDRP